MKFTYEFTYKECTMFPNELPISPSFVLYKLKQTF